MRLYSRTPRFGAGSLSPSGAAGLSPREPPWHRERRLLCPPPAPRPREQEQPPARVPGVTGAVGARKNPPRRGSGKSVFCHGKALLSPAGMGTKCCQGLVSEFVSPQQH